MQLELTCHPQSPAGAVGRVSVEVEQSGAGLRLLYTVHAAPELLAVAPPGPSVRTDGLWETTCFEAFLWEEDSLGYSEFNFAPSSEWAAYGLEGYRRGMHPLAVDAAPAIACVARAEALEVDVALPGFPRRPARAGISAVIQERDGTKSWWALAHPPGKPDFHHVDCFVLELDGPS